MWTIRQDQVERLKQDRRQKFEDEMVPRLTKLFPQTVKRLDESVLREAIRYGIERARGYGIVRRRDVARYIAVMFMFGSRFDQRIASGPLSVALRDPRLRSSRARADALCKAAVWAIRSSTARTGKKPCW